MYSVTPRALFGRPLIANSWTRDAASEIDRIVCAVDLSANSLRVVRCASEFTQQYCADLRLVLAVGSDMLREGMAGEGASLLFSRMAVPVLFFLLNRRRGSVCSCVQLRAHAAISARCGLVTKDFR